MAIVAAGLGCSGESGSAGPTPPQPPLPPATKVLLKDIEVPSLPSPYYHFEYDTAGRVSAASFASGFTMYSVSYDGGRISALTNNTAGNGDKLTYTYDDAGRVALVKYTKPGGAISTVVELSYDGQRLTGIRRSRQESAGYIVDKTMSFTYYTDGNVFEVTEHHPGLDGFGDASTVVDRYEQYDDQINVDAFSLLHTEFFDHLVLLPGVQLQKGNPARVIHTGDGINYDVTYTYVYDQSHRPLSKTGALTYTNGADAGKQFQTLSVFSYY